MNRTRPTQLQKNTTSAQLAIEALATMADQGSLADEMEPKLQLASSLKHAQIQEELQMRGVPVTVSRTDVLQLPLGRRGRGSSRSRSRSRIRRLTLSPHRAFPTKIPSSCRNSSMRSTKRRAQSTRRTVRHVRPRSRGGGSSCSESGRTRGCSRRRRTR